MSTPAVVCQIDNKRCTVARMLTTFGERLREARLAANLTQTQLAKLAGISQQAIQKAERSKSATSSSRFVVALARVMKVSPDWLASGMPTVMYMSTGSDLPSDAKTELLLAALAQQKQDSLTKNTAPGPDLRPPIPLISWVQAGNWTECTEPYPPGVADEWVSPSTRVSACAFALTVRGDSMEPRFTEGETLIVDPELDARHGDFVIVRLDDAAEATFKQLVIDGPQKFLKPLNARYPVVPINGNATIVGVVVEKRQVFLR
jgi:SOS-response transcriptional repressor LexA/DNA-binding XRE family transcriptional regulator